MMFSSSYFTCLLLAFLAQQASAGTQQGSSLECPVPGRVNRKLQDLCDSLTDITNGFDCVYDIIAEQCPCLSEPPECFETKVNTFLAALQAFSTAVQTAKTAAPDECPDRTGAVFVASCNGTDVAVVDPNGFIQNGFTTAFSVEGWTLESPFSSSDYAIDYYRNNFFFLQCKLMPSGDEYTLAKDDETGVANGITFSTAEDLVYVAMTFDNDSLNGIYTVERNDPNDFLPFCLYEGDIGNIYICGGYLYMSDGQEIIRKPLNGIGAWEQVLRFSKPPLEFVVLEDGRIVFCDESGALYVFDPAQKIYKQLKKPNDDDCCGSIKVSPCDSLIYVANKGDADIEIYNARSFTYVGSLTYTTSTPSPCPSIACNPTFWMS